MPTTLLQRLYQKAARRLTAAACAARSATLGAGFEVLEQRQLLAITATISYEYDTQNFFNTQAKRDLLQSAVDEIVGRFADDLDSVVPSGGNTWTAFLFHPGTGNSQNIANLVVQQDELIIYAGGRELGSTLGQGGPGGFAASGSSSWLNRVQTRGEQNARGDGATDFGPWGGSLAFDTTTNWHFGETTVGLNSGETDFYSVALHEAAHLLGFGASDAWDTYVNSSQDVFLGPAAVAEYDLVGNVPLSSSESHWASGTLDGGQETAMDPSILAGTRKLLTDLDLAGLADVGWEVQEPPPPQEAKLTANDPALADWFGYAVDIDGNRAVVAAKLDDDDGSASGSVYIYELAGGSWNQVAKLTASDAQAGDQFGHAVSISGDTVVVGAWLEDSNNINAGAAYVFQQNQGGTDNWGQLKKLVGSDTTPADKFGWSVAIDGDTIAVGANEDDPAGSASGSVYIFERNVGGPNNWGEVTKLVAGDASALARFGHAVELDGDTLVVGANLANSVGTYSGAAYVFGRNQGGANKWGEVQKITPADLAVNDQFGYSISIDGDRIVIGSWLDDFDQGVFRSNAGSVYVFEQSEGGTNNWGQVAKSFANDPGAGARLGSGVALAGDQLLAGAIFDDATFSDAGSAYIFDRTMGGNDNWGQADKRTAIDPHINDNFGISVAMDGQTALIGAYVGDSAVNNSGVAYVYVVGTAAGQASQVGGSGLPLSSGSSDPQLANDEPSAATGVNATLQRDPVDGCDCGGVGCAACFGASKQTRVLFTTDVFASGSVSTDLAQALAAKLREAGNMARRSSLAGERAAVPWMSAQRRPQPEPVVEGTRGLSDDTAEFSLRWLENDSNRLPGSEELAAIFDHDAWLDPSDELE